MARPNKESMAYFSHDCDARNDRKLRLYLSETGLPGLGFYWSVVEDIYNNSYYLPWTKEDQELYVAEFNARKYPVSFDDISFFIEVACHRDLFNESIFEKYSVFTSPSVQRRYLKQASRRILAEIREDFLLININEFYESELKTSTLSVKIVDKNGDTVSIYGDYVENSNGNGVSVDNNKDNVDNSKEKEYEEKYDFDCEYEWDGDQPIDYAGCIERWNKINGAAARNSKTKHGDLRRAFRQYTGFQILNAMIVRAKHEKMKNSKYKTQWSTFFGAKKLENLDKWVERGIHWRQKQHKLGSDDIQGHLDEGWKLQRDAADISDHTGMDLDDSIWWETKKVGSSLLYYPKFDY